MKKFTEVYESLSLKDKVILMSVYNKGLKPSPRIDMATLPFVDSQQLVAALDIQLKMIDATSPVGKRVMHELNARLKNLIGAPMPGYTSVMRRLQDGKVAKWFGTHPERGRAINRHVKRVTVGLKSPFGRSPVPDDDVLVPPMVALNKQSNGQWKVSCESRYLHEVDQFLIDNCM